MDRCVGVHVREDLLGYQELGIHVCRETAAMQ